MYHGYKVKWCVRKLLFLTIQLFICLNVTAEIKPADKQMLEDLRKLAITQPAIVDSITDGLIKTALAEKDSFKYARLLNTKGIAKRNLGKYAEAIKYYHLGYDISTRIGSKKEIVSNLSGLGVVMIRTQQFEEAKNYFLDALKIVDKKDSMMMNVLYSNLGVAYDYSDKTDLAIETYDKALSYTDPKDYYSVGALYHNIGVCYSMLENYKKAEEYELLGLSYQKKCGNLDLLTRIGISLGSLYLDQKMPDKALYYYEMGGEAASKINSIELEKEYYEHLVDLYKMKKDADKALFYYDKLNKLKSKLYSEENSKNVAEAETKFKVAIKNKEIENLKISKSLSDLKEERNRMLRNVLMVIVLLAIVLLFILYHNYQLRKKNFALLVREKQLVESEKVALEKNNEYLQSENILARFEILKSQVSPHFLFNTLNSLSYLIESDPEKAVDFTNAFSKLYRTILELKDQNLITLEQELNHVKDYFFLQHTRFGEKLKIEQHIDPSKLYLKLPPFSIQLAVENAINHNAVTEDQPLIIRMYCDRHFLVIENNLQPKTKSLKSTSLGIANIRDRYSFFTDTKPEFNKTDNSFIVKLPLLNKV